MTSLQILHTVEFYAPHVGGAETVVQKISEGLVNRGHRVTVATTKLPDRDYLSLNGVEIAEFSLAGNIARSFEGPDLRRYINFITAMPVDVMMNYAAQQWATDLVFEPLTRGLLHRVNIIAPCGYSALRDIHTLDVAGYGTYYKVIIPGVLRIYDAAIYHSQNYKDFQYASRVGVTNSHIIPNFVSENGFLSPLQIDFRKQYNITTPYMLLTVGNFLTNKGQENMIKVIRELNRPDVTAVMIGRDLGTLSELRAQAEGLPIKFLTDLPRSHTVAAFRSADVFMFGSLIEASPLVILEAKASKLPFISSDCGNVRDYKGGIICEFDRMKDATNLLLNDRGIHKVLAEEGFKEWYDNFTESAVVTKYEDLYLDLVDRRRAKFAA